MIRTTFNKLREVKDSLPKGSSAVIAEELGITADDVRAYFNGTATVGYHIEQGPDGGIVILEDTKILEVALRHAWASKNALWWAIWINEKNNHHFSTSAHRR